MGLSLVEAFSLMALGRTTEAGAQYASLDVPRLDGTTLDGHGPDGPNAGTSDDVPIKAGRPAGRMNSE
jgi:hypothetical protein